MWGRWVCTVWAGTALRLWIARFNSSVMLSAEHGPRHSQSGRECDDGARITLDGVGLGKGKGKDPATGRSVFFEHGCRTGRATVKYPGY